MVTWLYAVAAGLLMASLSPQPLMTALVQSALALPSFVLGAPAGAISDLLDRRRIMLGAQFATIAGALAVLGMSLAGALTPWALLVLTFVLGCATALASPAWVTAVPDLVPAAARLSAVGMNSVAYNASRAIGPALAGAMIAFGSVDLVFGATAAIALVVLAILWRFCPPLLPPVMAPEPVASALRSGLRYARHSPVLHACFLRTIGFVIASSALWALLPLVARGFPGPGTASAYAWMLGSLGAGAVAGGLLVGRIRALLPLPRLVNLAGLLFALATAVTAAAGSLALVVATLFVGGVGWVINSTTISATLQTSVPSWVRSRVMSLHMLVFQGSLALGSSLWGLVANSLDVPATLLVAAVLLCVVQLVTARSPLALGTEAETSPADAPPDLPSTWVTPAESGAVAVQIAYVVDPAQQPAFIRQAHEIGRRRLRDGARSWRLYRDMSDNCRLLERFVVDSWDDYLRHRERATQADRAEEAQLATLLRPGSAPHMSHFMDQPLTPEV